MDDVMFDDKVFSLVECCVSSQKKTSQSGPVINVL